MMRFRYTAASLEGPSLTGEIEAIDEAAAAADFGRRGLMLISLTRIGSDRAGGFFTFSIDPQAVTSFLRELALVLRSSLPLDEALDVAGRDVAPRLSRTVMLLRQDILGGASLVQALERRQDVFPPELVAMARVAEVTGDLDGMFAAVATERERAQRLREKLQGALRYPAFLIGAAVMVLLFFLLHVIPQFAGLFNDTGSKPGSLVSVMLSVSGWLVANQERLATAAGMALAGGLLIWRIPAARSGIIKRVLSLPVVGEVWMMWRTTRFLSNLAVLIGQGVPLTDTLSVLGALFGVDGEAAFATAHDQVRRGGRLHDALSATGLFPPVAMRMVRVGEETGELAKIAAEAAALYGHKLEKRLDQVTAVIGPAAILSIAVLVGGLMVTIMTALISVNETIQ